MTRPTSVVLGLSAAATALSLTFVNSTGVASAAPAPSHTVLPASPSASERAAARPAREDHPARTVLAASLRPMAHDRADRRAHHRDRARKAQDVRRTYTVQPGDSFWSIAAAKGVSWYNLAADNHLEMYSVLDAGQVLTLPAKGEKAHAAMPLGSTAAVTTSTPYVSAPAVTPTISAPAATSGFEQCVISRESGGDADVTNGGGYWGLFQFSPSTWAAYGGSSADFGRASAGEQEQVFQSAVAAGGASNWAPYDGC